MKEGSSLNINASESPIKNITGAHTTFFDFDVGSQNLQQHFKSLTDMMSEGLAHCQVIYNDNGVPINYRFLSVNPSFEKHTGVTPEMCVGKTILEIMPDVEKSWIEFYGKVGTTLKSETITGYNKQTKRYYKSTGYSDTIGEFMMLFEDITEQVELEKANDIVSKSIKLNNDLLDNMPSGFKHGEIICDSNNKPIDFKVLEINEAYEKQTGIKREGYVGKTIREFYPDVEQSWIEMIGEVALTGVPNQMIDYNHNTNKYFEVIAFSPKLGEFALFIQDVTLREKERIKLENAYKKIEESDKLKSTFLSNMSHEIRTPLNAILGFSELLEEKSLSQQEQKKCLSHIKNSGDKLLTIISDILDISKLDSNQQTLIYSKNNLNKIIDDLKEQFDIINSNPSSIQICTSKTLSFNESYINTDATRLEQILSNLIENALKYTTDGSVKFGYSIKKEFIEFFVSDTGIGIEPKHQKLIFERFNQVNENNGKINPGTGLGVSIANGFVKLFGGTMWLESKINKGSSFFFKIPYLPISIIDNVEQ